MAAILIWLWWNFAQWLGARKNKIEFVWDKNLITPSPILPPIFLKFALRPMGTSKRYNSVPAKIIARCVHLPPPYLRGRAILRCYLNSPLSTPVVIATIQKLQNFALQPMEISQRCNSVPIKDSCTLFAPTSYFWARAIWWCHLNFSPADPCCHGNEIWDKIDYNSAPVKDNCVLFAPTPLIRSC